MDIRVLAEGPYMPDPGIVLLLGVMAGTMLIVPGMVLVLDGRRHYRAAQVALGVVHWVVGGALMAAGLVPLGYAILYVMAPSFGY